MKKTLSALPFSALVLAGCVSPMPMQAFDNAGPPLRPETFFAGHTHGWGVLQTRGGRPSRRFEVEGQGRTAPDGSFHLVQTVTWGDGHGSRREWVMRAVGASGYSATLTDAKGPVHGEVQGNVFHLRYRLAAPDVMMEQYLYLQADGRHVLNTATVTAMGIPVAHLSENIVRVGDEAAPNMP
jgi:hypothetical protein